MFLGHAQEFGGIRKKNVWKQGNVLIGREALEKISLQVGHFLKGSALLFSTKFKTHRSDMVAIDQKQLQL